MTKRQTRTSREVIAQRTGATKIITINRPDAYNAWTSAMRKDIESHIAAVNDDKAVCAVIVTGAGDKAFCAGQDLAETKAFNAGKKIPKWIAELTAFYDTIRSLEKPLICALNGVAAGSGFQFALLSDVVVGHEGVTIGQPEVNCGIPSIFGPWIIAESLGRSRAVELCLTGRMMDAAEAHRLGLIHHLVPQEEVLETALGMAGDLSRKPPNAMRLTKKYLKIADEDGYRRALDRAAKGQREAFDTGEPQRTMEEFFAVRAARMRDIRYERAQ